MNPERVFVGLGANLGDARQTLQLAVAALKQLPRTEWIAMSRLYRSAPVDANGPDFINAVAELRTSLEPQALLLALQEIEVEHGRQRPFRNAPRTLDLDLLLFGQRELHTPGPPELIVPHPRMTERAFVLLPLLDMDPALQHPRLGPLHHFLPTVADQAIEELP